MATDTDIALCIGCGKTTTEQIVCPGCEVVQSGSTEPDYFALFGLPRRLSIDLADLERRYYELSRQLHPDLFHDRSPAEQAASLRATALVNRGYRILKDPVRRALYWLGLHGESLGRNNERVPAELASLVFEVQEKLDELRADRRAGRANASESELRAVREDLRARLRASEQRLDTSFGRDDAQGAEALAETKNVLSELHYLRTLMRDVEKELEPEWTA